MHDTRNACLFHCQSWPCQYHPTTRSTGLVPLGCPAPWPPNLRQVHFHITSQAAAALPHPQAACRRHRCTPLTAPQPSAATAVALLSGCSRTCRLAQHPCTPCLQLPSDVAAAAVPLSIPMAAAGAAGSPAAAPGRPTGPTHTTQTPSTVLSTAATPAWPAVHAMLINAAARMRLPAAAATAAAAQAATAVPAAAAVAAVAPARCGHVTFRAAGFQCRGRPA